TGYARRPVGGGADQIRPARTGPVRDGTGDDAGTPTADTASPVRPVHAGDPRPGQAATVRRPAVVAAGRGGLVDARMHAGVRAHHLLLCGGRVRTAGSRAGVRGPQRHRPDARAPTDAA